MHPLEGGELDVLRTCAPQKVDPALIARVRPTIAGCFWPVFFFCGSQLFGERVVCFHVIPQLPNRRLNVSASVQSRTPVNLLWLRNSGSSACHGCDAYVPEASMAPSIE